MAQQDRNRRSFGAITGRTIRDRSELERPRQRQVFDYWQSLKRENRVAYEDFDILKIPGPLWPYLTVIEPRPDGDFYFRISGGHIELNNGYGITRTLLSSHPIEAKERLSGILNEALTADAPFCSRGAYVEHDVQYRRIERLLLPMVRRRTGMRLLLGVIEFQIEDMEAVQEAG